MQSPLHARLCYARDMQGPANINASMTAKVRSCPETRAAMTCALPVLCCAREFSCADGPIAAQCPSEGVSTLCARTRRSMQDLWDEGATGACRAAFVAGLYAFPATPSVALSDGRAMPVLGVSTWLQASVQATVEHALRRGFRCASGLCCLHASPVMQPEIYASCLPSVMYVASGPAGPACHGKMPDMPHAGCASGRTHLGKTFIA